MQPCRARAKVKSRAFNPVTGDDPGIWAYERDNENPVASFAGKQNSRLSGTPYMKMPMDFRAMSRTSRGKIPMWKSAQTLRAMTME
jgi:hypothetical protein